MGLPANYERSGREYWSLKAEMLFLDKLGTHRGTGQSPIGRLFTDPQRRYDLLWSYIQTASTYKHRQAWKDEAVAYAQQLIEELRRT